MRILNIHSRIINQPKENIALLFDTLASKDDKVWPSDWPHMRFKEGLKVGSKGGHGPIRYTVTEYEKGERIQFEFSKPSGFKGNHWFEIIELEPSKIKLIHTIDMNVSGVGIFTWVLAVRWLHDALLEDALDKVENHYSEVHKSTEWNVWVKILRWLLK